MIARIVIIAVLSGALAAVGLSRHEEQRPNQAVGDIAQSVSTGAAEQPSSRDERPTAPVVIDEAHETIGAYVWDGDKRVRILDLLWAVNAKDEIRIARFKGVADDGTEYDYSRPEIYKRVAHHTGELAGAYTRAEGGERFQVQELTYTLTPDGFLTVRTMSGISSQGEEFSVFLQGITCCQPMQKIKCVQATCQGTGCDGPTNCACVPSVPGSSCEIEMPWVCRGACGPANNCTGNNQDTCKQSGTGFPITCTCQ